MPAKRTAKSKLPEAPRVIEPLRTYGCRIQGRDQFYYDRYAFLWRIPIDKGAPRRIELFKKIGQRVNSTYFEWHTWSERMVETLCENQWVAVAGCSGSSKTHTIVGFACQWWLMEPTISSVILCSTTAKALRKRGWANVQQYHTTIPGPRLGNFVDSRMLWQANHGDDKHAIMGIAVEEGSTEKVADNIKGVHTRRQMVIIDEATAVPPAIYDACSNLYSYPQEFLLVMIGNPRSRLDEFGKFMEPIGGWKSVNEDSEEWETTPKINGVTGVCIRFDAEKSPNITEGRIVSRHLPTKERVEMRKRGLGSANDPTYWSNERGFPPPEGLNKNVISEVMLDNHNAYDRITTFTGENFRIIGSLDPARSGGDRRILRFFKMGEMSNGEIGLEAGPPIPLTINAKSSNPIDYQITEQAQRECEHVTFGGSRYVCRPENFGVDATGGGADLVDIMQRIWSPHVLRVVFSEAASGDPCSHEDSRPANEVYHNKRVEMYFRTANAIKSGQLKGIDRETAKELATIEYMDDKAKLRLMSKDDYRLKFSKSPDNADNLVIGVEVARRLGFKIAAIGKTVSRGKEFSALVQKTQAVYSDVSYAPEEDGFDQGSEPEELEPVESLYG